MSQHQNNDRLGKGLSAIIGGDLTSADALRKPVSYINKAVASPKTDRNNSDILRIPIGLIQPNPFQPRKAFDQEKLDELASSIRTLGLITPITVRKISDREYQIISGERRYKACRMAGLTEIPAFIVSANDQSMLEMAIVENIQRENLDPIEVALSYQRLMDECHLTQEAVADRIGKKRASVANQLRLLKLPLKVQHDLKVRLISVGHAKVLLSVDDAATQESLCDITIKHNLNVRQLEDKVKQILDGAKRSPESIGAQILPENCEKLQNTLSGIFGGRVKFSRTAKGSGTITIRFSSDKEIDTLLDAIK